MSPSDASRLASEFRDLPVPGPFGVPPQPDPSTWATTCALPLRSDFPPEAVALRSAAIAHATACVEGLTALRPLVERSDDREAVGDALDSLRGVLLALRDVGTDDPRAEDDPETVVTLGTILPSADQSAAERVRDLLAAHSSPHCGPKVTIYEDGSLLVDWPDGRAESFADEEAALSSFGETGPQAPVTHRHPGIGHPSYFPTGNDCSGDSRPVTCDGCGAQLGMMTPRRIRERTHVVDWQAGPAVCCDECTPRGEDDDTPDPDPVAAAVRAGLAVHSATLHVGGTVEFLAHSWAEGGFHVRADGAPRCDSRGNTVARHSVEPIDPASAAHRRLCAAWFNGD